MLGPSSFGDFRLKARGLSLEHVRDQVSDSRYGTRSSRLSVPEPRGL